MIKMAEEERGEDPLYKLLKKMEIEEVHTFLTGKKSTRFLVQLSGSGGDRARFQRWIPLQDRASSRLPSPRLNLPKPNEKLFPNESPNPWGDVIKNFRLQFVKQKEKSSNCFPIIANHTGNCGEGSS